jgi:hypothetical protein
MDLEESVANGWRLIPRTIASKMGDKLYVNQMVAKVREANQTKAGKSDQPRTDSAWPNRREAQSSEPGASGVTADFVRHNGEGLAEG